MRRDLLDLLKRAETIARQIAGLERDLVGVQEQIIAASKEHPPRPPKPRQRRTFAEASSVVQKLVAVLRDAGEPLPRKEIAARLNLTPWGAAYRLREGMRFKLVEKVGMGRYKLVDAIVGAAK